MAALTTSPYDILNTMLSDNIHNQLRNVFGSANIILSRMGLESYAYDSSPFTGNPDAVVFASSTEQICQLMRIAQKEGFGVIPRGAGTNLSGGCISEHGGVILAMNRLNRILEIDPVNETALVEPGVTNMALQEAAAPHDLMFAPDPASMRVATIGGNVAEGAGGMRGAKYGTTRDHLLGLEVVLADGTIEQIGGNNPFLPTIDLTGIFCGSEGTFGIITKILVKLVPRPEAVKTLLVVFDSIFKAGTAVAGIMKSGPPPATLELMDQVMVRAVDDFLQLGLPRDAEAVLLIEVDGCPQELGRRADTIREICLTNSALSVQVAASEEERQELWRARRSGNGALGRIKPGYVVQDVTVPRDKIPQMLKFVADTALENDVIIAQMAHAGDGNLHPHLLYDPNDTAEQQRVEKAAHAIFLAALQAGGTLTGEHGIGIEKRSYMPSAFSENDLHFMQEIKLALDPGQLLNKGKILPKMKERP